MLSQRLALTFEEQDGALYVTLDSVQVDEYVALAQAHVLPGCWHEVVGARWVFVFEDGVQAFDSEASDREIMGRCKALEPEVEDERTVMEMLYSVPFYRDVLFHADYGTMINSAEFSGTPGDTAGSASDRVAAGQGDR